MVIFLHKELVAKGLIIQVYNDAIIIIVGFSAEDTKIAAVTQGCQSVLQCTENLKNFSYFQTQLSISLQITI